MAKYTKLFGQLRHIAEVEVLQARDKSCRSTSGNQSILEKVSEYPVCLPLRLVGRFGAVTGGMVVPRHGQHPGVVCQLEGGQARQDSGGHLGTALTLEVPPSIASAKADGQLHNGIHEEGDRIVRI